MADPQQSTIPPPPTSSPDLSGSGSGSNKDRFMGLISRLSGGGIGAIEQKLQEHHAKRATEASLAQQQLQAVANEYARAKTDEERTAAASKWEVAKERYTKIAGQSKEAKPIIQQTIGLIEHLIGHGKGQQGQGPQGAGGGGGGGAQGAPSGPGPNARESTVPPPPSAGASAAPVKSTLPPPPDPEMEAMGAPVREQAADDTRKVDLKGREESATERAKIDGMRQGLEAAGLPKEEIQRIISAKVGGAGMRPKIKEEMTPDPNSSTGWAKKFVDENTGQEISRTLDVAPTRSLTTSESDSTTTDQFGNVSHGHTVRKPVIGPGGKSTTSTPAGGKSGAGPSASGGKRQASIPPPPLNADGHISSGAGNPQVVEAANQLLDGQDVLKINPSKLRTPAAALARKYGWEQGKFTPKEQVMLRESTTYLQKAMNDPALAALDDDTLDRSMLAQVLSNPDKEGMVGKGLSILSSKNLSPKQVAFVQMYNQLVGTISGLSSLVRSGRATEASIERLKAELPNPVTTKDSKDARARIKRLLSEIDVAMDKGTFTGNQEKSARSSTVPAPPSGKSNGVIKWTRDAQGNPIRVSR